MLGGSHNSMVKADAFSKRTGFPSHHSGSGSSDGVDGSASHRRVPTNGFEACTPKHLACAGYVLRSDIAIVIHLACSFFVGCSCDAQCGTRGNLLEEK